MSIGELDGTEKSFMSTDECYCLGSAAESDNTRPTGLMASSGSVIGTAP